MFRRLKTYQLVADLSVALVFLLVAWPIEAVMATSSPNTVWPSAPNPYSTPNAPVAMTASIGQATSRKTSATDRSATSW